MKTLDEIAIAYGTDKATVFRTVPHRYTPTYDEFFTPFREQPIKFMEIGIGGGESIQTWIEYFTQAHVFGVDKNCGTNPWNTVGAPTDPRYTCVQGDQSDPTFWECFKADYGKDWEVIVDDGGHEANQIRTSFISMWPAVKSGGLYCIEDLYGFFATGSNDEGRTFIQNLISSLHLNSQPDPSALASVNKDIASIHFIEELAIIRKK